MTTHSDPRRTVDPNDGARRSIEYILRQIPEERRTDQVKELISALEACTDCEFERTLIVGRNQLPYEELEALREDELVDSDLESIVFNVIDLQPNLREYGTKLAEFARRAGATHVKITHDGGFVDELPAFFDHVREKHAH